MATEELTLFSALISVVSHIIIFLIQSWSIRLRGIEYQIERNTLLLEQCFGPLTNYFKQTIVLQEFSTISSKETVSGDNTVSRYILHFHPGVLEKIEKIWDRFNFEINRFNPKLGFDIINWLDLDLCLQPSPFFYDIYYHFTS
ncbi:MAG: hypothetical protein ACFFDT_09515 [Candidatus Hodarchaeota archaeon]